MSKKVIIDPVSRIEGHLKIEAEVNKGRCSEAHSSGTLFRGFELVLRGRDPRDATQITQRICGVCPVGHAVASARCLDDAYDVKPPHNGRVIRNLIQGANYIQSHVLHFYHLAALDYVKGPGAPPFLPRYEGKGFYRLPAAVNSAAVDQYLEALEVRNKAQQMLAIFGGKMPHTQGIVVGGATQVPAADDIVEFLWRLKELQSFINDTYLPTVYAVAKTYPDYFDIGVGCKNLVSYGCFQLDDKGTMLLPAGVYSGGKDRKFDPGKITESVTYSWYADSTNGRHPSRGATVPEPRKAKGYSYLKAPRYGGKTHEVGPLARVWMANPVLSKHANAFLGLPEKKEVHFRDLGEKAFSVMGRHAARAEECRLVAEAMEEWVTSLKPGEPSAVAVKTPKKAMGMGLWEAPRGALGHWVSIEDYKIANYQCVVPTTWNCGPRDDDGTPGPVETALAGCPVSDPANPIELTRVVRSFDPCIACAVHVIEPSGETHTVKIG
jgi:hydrogenase large subunit